MYLLNTVLESSCICNLGSCLSAHSRSIASTMAQQRLCFQWPFYTFWGTVTYGATPWLVIMCRVSSVLLMFTEECCCPGVRVVELFPFLSQQAWPPNGHQAQQSQGCWGTDSGSHVCCAQSILWFTGSLQNSPFLTAILHPFNKHSQSNPFVLL